MVYAANDPGRAIVLGYESDGVWFRGVGVVLTVLFGAIGLVFVLLVGTAVLRAKSMARATKKTV
ncbi:hypothetical protein ACFFGR_06455 [Arthrobacter liuii]|uniref:Uncharacterized protein n=1 Tax=Arthrobacter liuii TaxID=1476996 RepID=A0ABQ2ARY0_9MICC|nr:hypothetical protein [Arthrobacter liuii]GGH96374.1 hypothetical protein GCM10007170_24070 [Arthrobacter liuii]